MTEIEKAALALLNEVAKEMGLEKVSSLELDMAGERALLRALEQHEAFRQEVSDAVEEIAKAWGTAVPAWGYLHRFIIAKPDPLVEALNEALLSEQDMGAQELADNFRAALAARGLEIREKQA